jgi:hypothetical protein
MECYICYEKESIINKFCSTSICQCKGTTKIHISCFEKLKLQYGNTCTICKLKFKNNISIYKKSNYDSYQLNDYEMLQEIFLLEEHFNNVKRVKIQEEKSCCIII